MNDSVEHELMLIVERAVRPVRASIPLKRRMREDLLAHLTEAFESEMELRDDTQVGLERAGRRFGDPARLTEELQQTVPWWDRVRAYGERMNREPGESLAHFFIKSVVFTLAGYAIVLMVVLPMMFAQGKIGDMGVVFRVMLAMCIFTTTFMFIFVSAATRIGLALYGDNRQRSKLVAARCMLATLIGFPVLFMFTYLALLDDVGQILERFRLACYLAPVFTFLLWAISRQAAKEFRHTAEWASLELDN
ncbi:MAG: hypothetical protein JXM70_29750 [Pirellulales bacterium]|nr:hypothetical protein [Pirellulales bacterium]